MSKRIIRVAPEVLSLLTLLGTILFLIIYWKHIPEQVPTHFDGAGQVTAWGDKTTVLILPIVGAVSYLLLTGCNAFVSVMQKNELPPSAPLCLSVFKLLLLVPFAVITVYSALAKPLPGWFTPVSIILPFIPITVLVVLALRWEATRRR